MAIGRISDTLMHTPFYAAKQKPATIYVLISQNLVQKAELKVKNIAKKYSINHVEIVMD